MNNKPPQGFANFLANIGKDCPIDGWKLLPEWEAFKAGYNAAVDKSNQAYLDRYDMTTTKERVFK